MKRSESAMITPASDATCTILAPVNPPAPLDWFAAATDLPALWRGWLRVQRNRGAAGGDGVTVRDFARDAGRHLVALQEALAGGVYQPGTVRPVDIPKGDAGVRRLAIPCVIDRVAQSAAAQTLAGLLDPAMSNASFGYRPGRSVAGAVARIAALRRAGYVWAVDGDIATFFDSVDHGLLAAMTERWIPDARLAALCMTWVRQSAAAGIGLPQGAPISPLSPMRCSTGSIARRPGRQRGWCATPTTS
jgi:CRISPR-associated protein Cas1